MLHVRLQLLHLLSLTCKNRTKSIEKLRRIDINFNTTSITVLVLIFYLCPKRYYLNIRRIRFTLVSNYYLHHN